MIESLKGMYTGATKSILKNTSLSDLTTDLLRYLEDPLPPKRVQWSGATGVTAEYSWEDYFRRQTIRRVHNLAEASSDSSSLQQRISGDSRISMDSVELELDHENVRPRHKHSVENFQQQKQELQEESENRGDFELAELEKGADVGSMDAIEVQDDFAFLLVEDCEDSSDDDNIPLATILSKIDFAHSANLPIVPEKPSSSPSLSSQNMQGVVGKLQLNRKSNFIIERRDVLAVETSTVPFSSPQECHSGERDSLDFHDRSSIELFRVQPLIIA